MALPTKDADLLVSAQTFRDAVWANHALLKLEESESTELNSVVTSYGQMLSAKEKAAQDAKNAVLIKKNARIELCSFIKMLQAKFDSNPDLSDTQRATLGMPPRNAVKPTPQPIVMPRPLVIVDFSDRLEHTIRSVSETNPHDRKLPTGLWSVNVFMQVDGTMPEQPELLQFATSGPRTPLVIKHASNLAGKTAYYALQYVGRDRVPGQLSEITAATIAA